LQIFLSSEHPADLVGLPGMPPLLSWSVKGSNPNETQLLAEIEGSNFQNFAPVLCKTVVADSQSQFLRAPGEDLESREARFYRVRIQTESGWSNWSNTVRHEASLLLASDFSAVAIGDHSAPTSPPALLRTRFDIEKPVLHARLYATAHGTFDMLLNGQRVGNEVLAPGWTPYAERLLVVAHDVTDLLQPGQNAWGVLLADGWFRGKYGFSNETGNYGTQTAFLGQLEVTFTDGSHKTIASDENWRTATGEIRFASIYDGTDFDFNKSQDGWSMASFDDGNWSKVKVHPLDKAVLEPRYSAPIRVIREFEAAISEHKEYIRVDLKQNIAGWLRIKVKATAGSKLVARHAEVLEPSGDLHTAALRFARASDSWTFATDGEFDLEPMQTFHGFQYADLKIESGAIEVLQVTGIAISSDLALRGEIETSHSGLNQLVSNTFWSLRDNFVSIPTDCPQRDERLGWTGDAQAFAYAAHTLVDGHEFYKTWLRDLEIEQIKLGGKVPVIVPDILSPRMTPEHPFYSTYGEAGWADAATVIPWSIYQAFGDEQILKDQLESMRGWVAHNSADHEGALIEERRQLGDWLDPDAPEGQPWAAKVSGQFMANAYHAHSVQLLAKAEQLVGDKMEATRLEAYFEDLCRAIWSNFGEAAAKTPTGAATLLEFGLAPAGDRQRIADSLAFGVKASQGRIATGFLGTPIILDALSKNGNLDAAFTMLLRDQIPSWLYPISKGATTIWERWNGIMPDGTINGGAMDSTAEGSGDSMISFNHYAYGAVVDWIYRNIGGITRKAPGYRHVSFAPRPHSQVTSSKVRLATGYGRLGIEWSLVEDLLIGRLEVPFGVTASMDLPSNANSLLRINGEIARVGELVNHGVYDFSLTNPNVANQLKAKFA
jgi:alpha-L-rhamnosidase